MTAYYNEKDAYCAGWLRNLISAGLIPAGDVDHRDIREVAADDVRGYDQAHFFAGIGGWPFACRLAEWPDNRPIWTGSCPCQPFSSAGRGAGWTDDRHLWPEFFRLIRERQPATVMGEQVTDAVGMDWLDGVLLDLEGIGYACGAAVIPACAVDAPQRRARIWFVGRPEGQRSQAGAGIEGADMRARQSQRPSAWGGAAWVTGADGRNRRIEPGICLLADGVPSRVARIRSLGNAVVPQVAAEVIAAWMECEP